MPQFLRSALTKGSQLEARFCRRNFHIRSQLSCKDDSKKGNETESPLKRLLDDSASFEDTKPSNPQQRWTTMPYPQASGTNTRRQGDSFHKAKKDPKDCSIILFPGQGSQYVGMAKDLQKFPMARDLFELASYILKYDLLKLCLEGPKKELDQTRYSQPAILVTSLAAIERLKEERPNAIKNCVATAGFSLGEITALIFAGALGFEKGLQLVQIRAEAMQLASETHQGGMLTVFYGPDSKLSFACKQAKQWAVDKGDNVPECKISTYLSPNCKVVAGSLMLHLLPPQAIEYLEANYQEYRLRKVHRLPVSGGFHSELMASAVEPFRRALNKAELQEPIVSVYSNLDGKRYRNVEHIKKQLPKQITRPVKWEQLLHVVYERNPDEDFPNTFECGPGQSLKAILKQVNLKAWTKCYSIEA
ncbi:probable malonyl-CoA-acyl carrier protein transacylase, mitochondrial isoform X1 [Dendroctonus ponderosae]|uniref:probable malonyl-CoA-acyl carrier protein transacylase, mitochondrial isoform X1 n=1 Tax=Dendroctonus ponderosae TaxID=77166 RepID=UPI002035193A|nr:probable malonyl-CoA-acyl carrier protein transacylase, mitochondrial isoform X1 [Dendroctonus ponderosae]